MVIKTTIPNFTAKTSSNPSGVGAVPTGGYAAFRLYYQSSSGSYVKLPQITVAQLDPTHTPVAGGPGACNDPVVWWQEREQTTNQGSHPSSSFTTVGETGWKATHLTGNWSQLNSKQNNNNNAGSMDSTIAVRSGSGGTGYETDKIHRLWGNHANGVYDLYFRIGLPNQGTVDIQKIKIEYVTVDSGYKIEDPEEGAESTTFSYIQ